MSQPFVGEIRMFAGNFAPVGWSFCSGQLVPISQNNTLFNLIGTTYGGDGQTTFALPNLQSCVPIHAGTGPDTTTYTLGEAGGAESVTLTLSQIPGHTHAAGARSEFGGSSSPENAVWASAPFNLYSVDSPSVAMDTTAIGNSGGSQPHDNMLPFLCVNFILSLFGVFPSQT